jgi:hypothetical protein
MWRILLPFLRFAIDCLLGLGAFAVMSALLCGLWAGTADRPHRQRDSLII